MPTEALSAVDAARVSTGSLPQSAFVSTIELALPSDVIRLLPLAIHCRYDDDETPERCAWLARHAIGVRGGRYR